MQLPGDTPEGYHTIVIEGKDSNGELRRIWKMVYVDGSGGVHDVDSETAGSGEVGDGAVRSESPNSMNDKQMGADTAPAGASDRYDEVFDQEDQSNNQEPVKAMNDTGGHNRSIASSLYIVICSVGILLSGILTVWLLRRKYQL